MIEELITTEYLLQGIVILTCLKTKGRVPLSLSHSVTGLLMLIGIDLFLRKSDIIRIFEREQNIN